MKKSLLIILCTLMSVFSWAQGTTAGDGSAEPYAVLKGDTLLTFYYDDQKATRNGMDIGPFNSTSARGWHSARETITSVVFDDSFANYDALTSMNMWFYNLTHLTSVTGISNLNTANVTSFRSTFSGCSSLTSLDLSSLNTSKVKEMNFMFEGCSSLTDLKVGFSTESVTTMANMFLGCSSLTTLDLSTFNTASVKSSMDYMFSSCSALTTIYVSDLWTTTNVTTGNEMFNACQNLVGGQGTSFSTSHRALDYAHIDGGENNPGYFTDKNATPSQNFAEYIWEVGVNNNWDGDREPLYCGDGRGTYVGFFYAQEADWSEGKGAFKFRGAPDNWDNGNYGTGTINQDGLSGTLINDNASGNIIAEPAFYRAEVNLANMTYQLTSISAIGIIGPAQSGGWNIDTDMTYNKETRAWEATVDLAADEFKFRANHAWDINWGGTADSLIANGDNLRIAEAGTYFIQFFPLCETKSYCIITKKSSAATTPEVAIWAGEFVCAGWEGNQDLAWGGFDWTTIAPGTKLRFYYKKNTAGAWGCISLRHGDSWGELPAPIPAQYDLYDDEGMLEVTFTQEVLADIIANGGLVITGDNYTLSKVTYPIDEDLKDDVYTIGETDFSTEFYTQFSKYYQIPQGGKWVSKFKLNLNPNDNRIYKNFVLLITNDEDRGAGQYKEYGAFRYDAVADSTRTNSQWGTSYVFPFQYTTSTLYLEPDENEMDPNVQKLGGLVTLTVDRSQADAFVITMSNEQGVVKTYRQPYVLPNFNNDSTNTNIRCFITVENSQLEFKGSNIEPIGGYSAPVATVEPYAVLKGDTLLTFYYDDQKSVRGGIAFLDGTDVYWPSSITRVTQAVFDSSFADFSPTSTAHWFASFSSLTTITGLENLKMNNVESVANMFDGCSLLTSLDLSSWNTEKIINLSSLFNNCTALSEVNLAGWNVANVMYMNYMFANCTNLKTIYANSSWTLDNTGRVTGWQYVFSGCTSLVGGAGTQFDPDHVDTGYAHIDGGVSNPGYFTDKNASYNEAYAVLVSEDGGNIMYATLYYDGNKASHTEGFAVVGLDEMLQNQAWMMNRSNIKTVNFDESFANCNPTSTAYWFAFCNSLTAINGLQYLNTEYVTNMEYMFHMCPALTSIDLSHFRAKSLTNMNSMFGGCSSLTSLDLSGFFTFTVTNMNYLFSGCTNLKTIYVNKYDWSTESVTAGDGVFENCTSLVGGAGTTFNDSHIDYTYARIDGGPNSTTPGYFTDKDATSKVATPTFSWNEHTLTVSSATEGATIVYNNLKENPVMVEGEGILLYQTYTYTDPLTIIENAELLFWAQKDGMANSDSITLNYPYTAWVALTDTLTKAKGIYDLALNNANVPDQMKSELASAISVGDSIYQVRNSSVDEIQSVTNRIFVIANEVASLISAEDEPYAVLSENNTVVTFYYDDQKTARGGVDINNSYTNHYSSAKTVVFDASFANYRPESTAYWFNGLKDLETFIGLEYLNTSNVTSFRNMFKGCRSLKNLDLSGFDASKVTDMKQMFEDCSSLKNLNLRNFNTDSATNMGDMFCACSSLESLDLSSFNTVNVTKMSYMFAYCSSLKTLGLSSFNTANVTNMEGMFHKDSLLTTIYVGESWSTANVSSEEHDEAKGTMFQGCIALVGGAGTPYDSTHVDYTYAHIDEGESNPGYFTKGGAQGPSVTVVAPEFRFEGDNLTMSTTTQNASIFYNMAELASMDEAYVDSVKSSLVVTVDAIHSTYYEQPFELKKNAVVKAIAVMDGPSGMVVSDTTTMVYDYEAWVNLREAVMKGVDLYDRAKGNPNVDTQLLEDLQWALKEGDMIYNQRAQMDSFEATHFTQRINDLCAQIEAQMAAEDEPYAVLSTDGLTVTFYYDTQKNARGGIEINNSFLQEDMPSPYGTATTAVFDASFANYRPVSTAHWFQHCRSLTSITNIEYLNTVNVTDMTAMFHKCSSLPSLDLSNFNTSNVTDMTAMFGDCSSLTNIDLSNFNTTNVTGMNGMFAGCSGLTNIDLSNFNTTNVMDMSLMFHSCSGLTNLDLSNFNTAKVTNMESMFRYCSELKTIYIGNEWSTNAVEFGSEMFDGCTNLVGGAGTVYDANHTDHTYAHIDGGENNPGYFTDKNPVEASYYDHVLYVGGSVTLAEAMQKFGTNNVVETIAAIVWNSSQAISTSELQVITNPNLLIYVQDASLAPANRDNVVINGFAKNVVLSDVTSGNNNFYCPEEFTAEAISYTRNFQQQTEIGISRGWESIALPFDVQTIMHEKNGVLSPFGSSEGGKPFWLRQMSDNGLVQAIEIHANRPYLISMPNCTEYPAEFNQPGRVTFSSLNVRVPVTEEETVAMADSTIVLIPTFQRMEQSDWIYALNVGETRAQYPEGSVFEQGLRAVRPFEAFTVHNNNQSNPAPRYIAINEIGNGTTGIENIVIKDVNALGDRWYSLDGRLLQGKPAQKGIYIYNGKKKIIK